MVTIIILRLAENKFFIFKWNKKTFDINDFNYYNYKFTLKFPPIGIYKTYNNCDIYDEDKYVKIYMDKFGIQNVRGGSYTSENLSIEQEDNIYKELQHANNISRYNSSEFRNFTLLNTFSLNNIIPPLKKNCCPEKNNKNECSFFGSCCWSKRK